jgi:hypothetical protein
MALRPDPRVRLYQESSSSKSSSSAGRGLSGKQIAHQLGISVRTVEDHFSALRQRTGAHSQGELIAYGATVGLVKPRAGCPGNGGL